MCSIQLSIYFFSKFHYLYTQRCSLKSQELHFKKSLGLPLMNRYSLEIGGIPFFEIIQVGTKGIPLKERNKVIGDIF